MLDPEILLSCAKNYGTPLFVYDGDMVVERVNDLHRFIPCKTLKVHYAMKANYNVALLKMLKVAKAGIDAVSPGEVLLALKVGFAPKDIIYTANNMTDAEVALVKQTGVLMNIGELSRLEKFGKAYPGSEVCLRFNPDVCDGDSEKTMTGGDLTKFGILLDHVDKVLAIVKQYKLKVIGLHEHTGSGLQHAESVYQSMRNLMKIATPANFPDLKFLDFGGGFKVPYKPDEKRIDYVKMGKEIAEIFAGFCKGYGRELDMYFEPGKFVAAEAGYLLVEVNTIKHNRIRVIAGCNSGFPQLIRPVMYNAYHHIKNLSNPDGKTHVYDICGNICETGDRFAEQREMPEIREGDILAIENAGAYCYSMGGVYNVRPMPAEVVISNRKVISSRRAETNEELAERIFKGF